MLHLKLQFFNIAVKYVIQLCAVIFINVSRTNFNNNVVNFYVDACASVKVEKKWQEKLRVVVPRDVLCEALLVS